MHITLAAERALIKHLYLSVFDSPISDIACWVIRDAYAFVHISDYKYSGTYQASTINL